MSVRLANTLMKYLPTMAGSIFYSAHRTYLL